MQYPFMYSYMENLRVLGVCCGNGNYLWPFKDYLVGGIEPRAIFHTPKEMQWNANYNKVPYYKDEFLGFGEIDLILGSPDCGDSSKLRYSRAKKLNNASKNSSIQFFIRHVSYYEPSFFLFENLEKVFDSFPKEKFQALLPNYHFLEIKGSVARFGNSQKSRKRLVLVGINTKRVNLKQTLEAFKLPNKENSCKKAFELLDSLENNTQITGNQREADDFKLAMKFKGDPLNVSQVKALWNGVYSKEKKWPMPGTKMKNLPGVNRFFKNDYPFTVRKQNRQFDYKGRVLTPRQMARIQGIPDDFKIYVDSQKLNYWLNKGRVTVSKTFPNQISEWLYRCLRRLNYVP